MVRKIIFGIIQSLIALIMFLLALVFVVIEGRLLISGDWLVYDNVAFGFMRYLCRVIIFLFILVHSVLLFINIFKTNEKLTHFVFVSYIALLIACLFFSGSTANGEGAIAFTFMAISFGIKCVDIVTKKMQESRKNKENN